MTHVGSGVPAWAPPSAVVRGETRRRAAIRSSLDAHKEIRIPGLRNPAPENRIDCMVRRKLYRSRLAEWPRSCAPSTGAFLARLDRFTLAAADRPTAACCGP